MTYAFYVFMNLIVKMIKNLFQVLAWYSSFEAKLYIFSLVSLYSFFHEVGKWVVFEVIKWYFFMHGIINFQGLSLYHHLDLYPVAYLITFVSSHVQSCHV
jgi:hypothetical protein